MLTICSYPCHWGGVVDGKAIVAGLERFGARMLSNLWNAIQKFYPAEVSFYDKLLPHHLF
jgi:telomerase protein component 1